MLNLWSVVVHEPPVGRCQADSQTTAISCQAAQAGGSWGHHPRGGRDQGSPSRGSGEKPHRWCHDPLEDASKQPTLHPSTSVRIARTPDLVFFILFPKPVASAGLRRPQVAGRGRILLGDRHMADFGGQDFDQHPRRQRRSNVVAID